MCHNKFIPLIFGVIFLGVLLTFVILFGNGTINDPFGIDNCLSNDGKKDMCYCEEVIF